MISKSDKVSERERLLKLIDGDPATLREAQRSNPVKESLGNMKVWLSSCSGNIQHRVLHGVGNLKGLFGSARRENFVRPTVTIHSINRVLMVILVLMTIYIAINLLRGTRIKFGNVITKTSVEQGASSEPVKLGTLEYYLDQIRGKDIFNVHRIEVSRAKEGDLPIADGLKFVGVDWGNPPTAMIEDVRNAKTHFIKKGDSIRELTVVDVLRDRVIVGFKDQLFELK